MSVSSKDAVVEVRGLAMGIKARTFVPISVLGTSFKVAFPKRDQMGILTGKVLMKMDIPVGSYLEFKIEGELVRLHFPQRDKIVIDGHKERVIIGKRTEIPIRS